MAKKYTLEEIGKSLKAANPKKFDNYSDRQLANYYLEAKPQAKSIVLDQGAVEGVAKGVGKSILGTVKESSGLGERAFNTLLKTVLPKSLEPKFGITETSPTLGGLFGKKQEGTSAEQLQSQVESNLDIVPGSLTEARTGAQKTGKIGTDIAQFLLPGKAVTKAGKAAETLAATRGLGKFGQAASRYAPQVASDIGIATAQTGSPLEGLKAGAVSAGFPAAGKAIKAVTKPIQKGISQTAKGTIGRMTGAQGEAITEAFKSPKVAKYAREAAKDTQQFQRNLFDDALAGLKKVKNSRSKNYTTQLKKITKDTKEYDNILNDVRDTTKRQALDEYDIKFGAEKKGKLNVPNFDESVIVEGQNVVEKAINDVLQWRNVTPEGLDKLKKRLFKYSKQLKAPGKGEAKSFVDSIATTLDRQLKKKITGYEEMTSGYRKATELIDELESTFSLKNPKKADTAIRKIMSSLREGNELRADLLNVLGPDFREKVAGSLLSSATPRGLAGVITPQTAIIGGALVGLLNPAVLFYLALTSPRLYAELGSVIQKIPASQIKTGKIAPAIERTIRGILQRAIRESDQGQFQMEQPEQAVSQLGRTTLGVPGLPENQ